MGDDQDRTEIHRRLRRLGISRGARELKGKRRGRRKPIEDLLAGEVVNTELGSFFLYKEVHGLDYCHGDHALGGLAAFLGTSKQGNLEASPQEKLEFRPQKQAPALYFFFGRDIFLVQGERIVQGPDRQFRVFFLDNAGNLDLGGGYHMDVYPLFCKDMEHG